MAACALFNEGWSEARCAEVFVPSTFVWWAMTKHMVLIHGALAPYAVYHNTGGRRNVPLLKISSFAFAVMIVGDVPHFLASQRAGEIERVPLHIAGFGACLGALTHLLSWFVADAPTRAKAV